MFKTQLKPVGSDSFVFVYECEQTLCGKTQGSRPHSSSTAAAAASTAAAEGALATAWPLTAAAAFPTGKDEETWWSPGEGETGETCC
jgi:hypothetical protein